MTAPPAAPGKSTAQLPPAERVRVVQELTRDDGVAKTVTATLGRLVPRLRGQELRTDGWTKKSGPIG